mmetsp:Transcript_31154/g.77543  ORF Transcript_31154/g.77543 Transcript_31154/m.77543 type:complete len:223 (-) Transcript_31154:14-682(-)
MLRVVGAVAGAGAALSRLRLGWAAKTHIPNNPQNRHRHLLHHRRPRAALGAGAGVGVATPRRGASAAAATMVRAKSKALVIAQSGGGSGGGGGSSSGGVSNSLGGIMGVCNGGDWLSLGTCALELRLDNTLPTGQSFRWRRTDGGDYVGVIGRRVVSMRQEEDDVLYRVHCRPSGDDGPHAAARDAAALTDYFNLAVSLTALSQEWAAADDRFRRLAPHLPG